MKDYFKRIQQPVKRQGAENNLLITLISFAGAVLLTRMTLFLSNYPQLGGGYIHIAHVLWGGIFLFIAALLPLIFTNRWTYSTSAFLAGAGVGLFIDEVGKFITQTNDYFFQPAATIIYAFFLLTVLLYLQIKKKGGHNARTELYRALDTLEEFLDKDLEKDEYEDVVTRLKKVADEKSYPELSQLASSILAFFESENVKLIEDKLSVHERIELRLQAFEKKVIKKPIFKMFLAISVAILGISSLGNTAILLKIAVSQAYFQELLQTLLKDQVVTGNTELTLFLLRLFLETVVGVLLVVSTYFWIVQNDKKAILFGSFGLLVSLTTINLLAFYFDQFRAVFGSLVELIILLGMLRFRTLYSSPHIKLLRKNG